MKKEIKIIIVILIILIVCYGIYYVNDYYPSDSEALKLLNGSENVSVVKISGGLFIDGEGNDSALIFYPGAKVEYTSYLPLLSEISKNGVDCFLVEMPFNNAFFGQNSADYIIDNYNYSSYYLAGHSLGGVAASEYIHNTNKSDALILLASYPISQITKPVLSIYGSEDKVLNMEKYNESKKLMNDFEEIIIKGGNHAQIGNYGNQSGDGKALITSQNEQRQIAESIVDFIERC